MCSTCATNSLYRTVSAGSTCMFACWLCAATRKPVLTSRIPCRHHTTHSISPLRPDYSFQLKLDVPDHRKLAWLLLHLGESEGGTSMQQLTYNGRKLGSVPQEWLAEVPGGGLMTCSFHTYARGVQPNWAYRLKQMDHVLPSKTDAILLS